MADINCRNILEISIKSPARHEQPELPAQEVEGQSEGLHVDVGVELSDEVEEGVGEAPVQVGHGEFPQAVLLLVDGGFI